MDFWFINDMSFTLIHNGSQLLHDKVSYTSVSEIFFFFLI